MRLVRRFGAARRVKHTQWVLEVANSAEVPQSFSQPCLTVGGCVIGKYAQLTARSKRFVAGELGYQEEQ